MTELLPDNTAPHDGYIARCTATWRRWAVAVAAGQEPPDTRELLDVGCALQVRQPAAALQDDAAALAQVRKLHARIVSITTENPRMFST
jgi:hypothetical protein